MTRQIWFANSEPIDLRAVTTMGVHTKPNSDSPIGYFGTGLKYAIATLLRHGQTIEIWTNGKLNEFSTRSESIRGESFDLIYLNGERLGFTTGLGKNWLLWQAYRELESNVRDEKGQSGEGQVDCEAWGTCIVVRGDRFAEEWDQRGWIFLQDQPLVTSPTVQVFNMPGSHLYYRGVRASNLPATSEFTYSLMEHQSLTEDRTFASEWSVQYDIMRFWCQSKDEQLLERALRGNWEKQHLLFSGSEASEEFMRVCKRHRFDDEFSPSALRLFETLSQDDDSEMEDLALDSFEQSEFAKAQRLLARLDCTISRSEFKVVKSLGEAGLGRFSEKLGILISRKTFDMGHRMIAGTLYEEWLHKEQHERDMTRSLQNLLLDKLMAAVDRLEVLDQQQHSTAKEPLNGPIA